MHNGKLSGYGMVRVCRSGYKIGPLFADSYDIAKSLYISLKSKIEPGQPIYLDVSEVNKDAIALAENHNMRVVFETARMYTGDSPDLPLMRIFGVTTFELG
jgi:Holliday junction resolvase